MPSRIPAFAFPNPGPSLPLRSSAPGGREKKWHADAGALRADALEPRVLALEDVLVVERVVVDEDLDRVRAGLDQATHAPLVEQVRQSALHVRVVTRLLVREEH